MPEHLWIYCADIGSVKAGRFGWYGAGPGSQSLSGSGITEFADAVAKNIASGEAVALGFECPLFVPLRDDPMLITAARNNEGNRSWSAGAGCGALATGLVEVAWILKRIRSKTPGATVFLDWNEFQKSGSGLYLWEAFVSGKAKGSDHAHDAKIAVQAFQAALPNPEQANAISEEHVLSLIGANMLQTGWTTDLRYLEKPCLVVKV